MQSSVASTAGLMVILIGCDPTLDLVVILIDSVLRGFDGEFDGDID